ncbi:helix-turn-helix transcriptional regulator [Actinoalloteichus caeruleus]|uniref:helix-turn-helix transcriptional regulator n=1 Tax=Actinoalloteichus cyanogriseus TaxID=2893586 RepID=UPI0006892228|nr:LuxR family transcriptional regulator [Actinoalloteichus caeruleus]
MIPADGGTGGDGALLVRRAAMTLLARKGAARTHPAGVQWLGPAADRVENAGDATARPPLRPVGSFDVSFGPVTPLVARVDEFATLRSAWRSAQLGRAGAVLLGGEAGVGKSRLLAELTALANADDAVVLGGRCLDLDRAGLPYLPFAEALGRVVSATGELPAIASRRAELGRLLPGLEIPHDTGSADGPPERLRLFDAVHGLLADLASDRPVLLALEDLHWADASTRDLVRFLVSRLGHQRLLVVATYRSDDLHRQHPLRPVIGELSRLPSVLRMSLRPFTPAETLDFVRVLTGDQLPDSVTRGIASRSEGNAFFCEELAEACRERGSLDNGLPAVLSDLLLARVERLSGDAQRAVRAAACGEGVTTSHAALVAASGLEDTVAEDALYEAVRQHVLVATTDGSYTFRHALVREAVYNDLLPGERVRLHQGFARVADDQGTTTALAYHARQSNDLPVALAASVTAAREVRRMGAPGESLHHLEQALQLWDRVAEPERVSGVDHLALLRETSTTAESAGELERAAAHARAAVRVADSAATPEARAAARAELAARLIPLEVHAAEISTVLADAWDLVAPRAASQERAAVLALMARSWVWLREDDIDLPALRRHAEDAIVDAESVGAEQVAIDAMVTLAVFASMERQVSRSLALGLQAAERATAIGAHQVELRARKNYAIHLSWLGHYSEGRHALKTITQRSEEIGVLWGGIALDCYQDLILISTWTGHWEEALAIADLSDRTPPALFQQRLDAVTLPILSGLGRHDEFDRLAARLDRDSRESVTRFLVQYGRAVHLHSLGRHREALHHVRHALAWIFRIERMHASNAVGCLRLGLSCCAELTQVARRSGDTDTLAEIRGLADGFIAQVREIRDERPDRPWGSPESAARSTQAEGRWAEAEYGRLLGRNDPATWRSALALSEGLRAWQAHIRFGLAQALTARGDRPGGDREAAAALALADEIGAAPLRTRIERFRAGSRLSEPGEGAHDAAPDHHPTPPGTPDPLTPRERSALELAAAGLTNRQIGEDLHISPKTVSVHLSRVMAKLGATSRTEAVARAYEQGLLTVEN